jgi:hypothetical protein
VALQGVADPVTVVGSGPRNLRGVSGTDKPDGDGAIHTGALTKPPMPDQPSPLTP